MLSKIRLKKYPNVKQHDSSDCAVLGYLAKTKLASKIESLSWGTAKGIFAAGRFSSFVATALTVSLAGMCMLAHVLSQLNI